MKKSLILNKLIQTTLIRKPILGIIKNVKLKALKKIMTNLKPAIRQGFKDQRCIPGETMSQLMQEVLNRGAQFQFRASGLSMLPFIKDGDLLTVSCVQQEKPGYGKIVAFNRPGTDQLLIHRIIGKRGSQYLIQGDNTVGPAVDVVSPNNIIGCVTAVNRTGRPIHFGLGIERFVISFLSRNGWLKRILYHITK